MERKLPRYIIEGTPFIVDVGKGELREAANPSNTIQIDEIKYNGTHYSFNYDISTKNLPALFNYNFNDIKYVELPQMVTLDPVGMAEKFNLPVDAIKGKTDFELIVDPDLLEQRLHGVLPRIDIAGQDYIVDIRLGELRAADIPAAMIRLDQLDYSVEEEKYLGFYDRSMFQLVDINPDTIHTLPKNIVMVEIPSEWKLDPVGAARKYDCNPIDVLIKNPIHKDWQAKVVPLSQTALPEIIEGNKRKGQQQQLLPKKRTNRQRRRHKS